MKNWKDLRISILLTGSELIDGRLQDSNSLYLARYLFDRGQRLERILVCDDDEDAIVDSLETLAAGSDVIVCSGGLGPTTGDKTREAIAKFLKVELILDQQSLDRIKQFFAARNRKYESINDKQAFIPSSGTVICNDYGTAACFWAPYGEAGFISALPGVPREFEQLITKKVMPALGNYFGFASVDQHAPALRKIRIFGLGESAIGARVLESKPDARINVSYRATFPEVQVLFRAEDASISRQQVNQCAERAIAAIGTDFVFSQSDDQSLVESLHALLLSSGQSLALAESCTGGMLGELLTSLSGSSKYFQGAIVSYANEVKHSLLSVSEEILENAGAVSAEAARAMAEGVRQKLGTDIGLSITGIAGPDGGTDAKPVGTCFLGLSFKDEAFVAKIFFPSSRERIREYACAAALDLLRRRLLRIPVSAPLYELVG